MDVHLAPVGRALRTCGCSPLSQSSQSTSLGASGSPPRRGALGHCPGYSGMSVYILTCDDNEMGRRGERARGGGRGCSSSGWSTGSGWSRSGHLLYTSACVLIGTVIEREPAAQRRGNAPADRRAVVHRPGLPRAARALAAGAVAAGLAAELPLGPSQPGGGRDPLLLPATGRLPAADHDRPGHAGRASVRVRAGDQPAARLQHRDAQPPSASRRWPGRRGSPRPRSPWSRG